MIKYPEISVRLSGEDGNGFVIVGRVSRALRQAGIPAGDIESFRAEAMSGDYDHLLLTVMATVETT